MDNRSSRNLNSSLIPNPSEEDVQSESNLRPRFFHEYVGQKKVTERLQLFIQAAQKRNESLDHVLLHGFPGLGKTTMAHIISSEMRSGIRCTSGPVIERPGDLAAILTNLQEGEVLFVDEIHRLSPVVEEILYPAMEDFQLDLVIGQGAGARTVRIDLPRFTMVGATTRAGLLSPPFRDRFGISLRLDFYDCDDLQEIVKRSSRLLNAHIEPGGALEIAKRSRGTPRIANRLLRRVRDFAEIMSDGTISEETADKALSMLDVDHKGLDTMDRDILSAIILKFGGGPVGIDTLATSIGEESSTIEDVYEPFLVQQNYIHRTPRGRVATEVAYKHLNITPER